MKLNEVIKLGGNSNQNTKAFMADFIEATKPTPVGHGRLFGDVLIDLSEFGGEIHISDIMAAGKTQTGSGTKALKFLTGLADEHGVRLSGIAKAYSRSDDHIQSSDRLMQWYEKHGFVSNGDKITYTPSTNPH